MVVRRQQHRSPDRAGERRARESVRVAVGAREHHRAGAYEHPLRQRDRGAHPVVAGDAVHQTPGVAAEREAADAYVLVEVVGLTGGEPETDPELVRAGDLMAERVAEEARLGDVAAAVHLVRAHAAERGDRAAEGRERQGPVDVHLGRDLTRGAATRAVAAGRRVPRAVGSVHEVGADDGLWE